MRIVLWAELFWPYLGGAELFSARLMDALRGRGHEFAVVTSHGYLDLPDEGRYHGIPIYRFRFREVLVPHRLEELARVNERVTALLGEIAPQLILLNGVSPNAFCCLHATQVSSTPLLVRLNRELAPDERLPRRDTLLGRALERAAWVVGVSTEMLAAARRLVPGIASRSSLIFNGVNAPAEMPDPPAADTQRILCLGRLVSDKRFDRVITALPAILRRCPQARLTIAGDGPERRALQEQSAALGVAQAVEFVGWVAPDAVPRLIATANVVAAPSRSEGLPAVALEAAAMRRPVVASPTGGLLDVVERGRTGLLVYDDVAELTAAVAMLLEQPVLAAQMGARAWHRARELFAPQRCVDAYDALCRELGAPA